MNGGSPIRWGQTGYQVCPHKAEIGVREMRWKYPLSFKMCWMAAWIRTKNGVKRKKLLCFLFIFGIIGFGIREIHLWIGWFGERFSLPNRGTANDDLPVRV